MNSVAIIGRLTSDPKPFYDQKNGGELSFCLFTLAVPRQTKDKDLVDFIPVSAFDHGAKFAMQYFHKGMRVGVQGLLHSSIQKTKNGETIYPVSVTAKQLDFADAKRDDQQQTVQSVDAKPDFMQYVDANSEEGVVFN